MSILTTHDGTVIFGKSSRRPTAEEIAADRKDRRLLTARQAQAA